jgi:ubiquinone biosynthesis monooxygenase Coq7
MLNHRKYSITDYVCLGLDQAIRAMGGNPKTTERMYPAHSVENILLTEAQRKHSAALMRINHTGEVCAQALYHGQALASRNALLKQKMQQAAVEEGDHLAWCSRRLLELGSHTSYLNFLWYMGSFSLGLSAGLLGDAWSLGFLAETETQVVEHLEKHLQLLSDDDSRSSLVLQQMQIDEAEHRDAAMQAGARKLPTFIKKGMQVLSKIMVKTTYWL